MGASTHKVVNPITVIQSLPDRVVGNAQNLKASFDLIGETVRLKHNTLCDYVDSDIATKAEIQGLTLGQIVDGTITSEKLSSDALTAEATLIGAETEALYALPSGSTAKDALDLLPFARWYGKENEITTSQSVGYGQLVQSAIALFQTKVVDDFNNLEASSYTKMIVPPGATKVQFTVTGYAQQNWSNNGAGGRLYKNGVFNQDLWSASVGGTYSGTVIVSKDVSAGDYFQVYIYGSVINDTSDSTNRGIASCSKFNMTVLK